MATAQATSEPQLGFPPKGSLRRVAFPRLMREVARNKLTGSLYLLSGQTKKVVFFQEGQPVFVRSNVLSECLGQILSSEGLITQEQCEQTLEAIRRTGKKQGELLVEMGILSEGNLRYGLEAQLRAKLYDIFAWEDGRYQFKSDPPNLQYGVRMEHSAESVIIGAIQDQYSEERAGSALAPSLDKYLTLRTATGLRIETLGLLEEERYFVECVDGSRTVAECVNGSVSPPVPTPNALVFALIAAGVVSVSERGADAKEHPAPPELTPSPPPDDELKPDFDAQDVVTEYEDTPLPGELPQVRGLLGDHEDDFAGVEDLEGSSAPRESPTAAVRPEVSEALVAAEPDGVEETFDAAQLEIGDDDLELVDDEADFGGLAEEDLDEDLEDLDADDLTIDADDLTIDEADPVEPPHQDAVEIEPELEHDDATDAEVISEASEELDLEDAIDLETDVDAEADLEAEAEADDAAFEELVEDDVVEPTVVSDEPDPEPPEFIEPASSLEQEGSLVLEATDLETVVDVDAEPDVEQPDLRSTQAESVAPAGAGPARPRSLQATHDGSEDVEDLGSLEIDEDLMLGQEDDDVDLDDVDLDSVDLDDVDLDGDDVDLDDVSLDDVDLDEVDLDDVDLGADDSEELEELDPSLADSLAEPAEAAAGGGDELLDFDDLDNIDLGDDEEAQPDAAVAHTGPEATFQEDENNPEMMGAIRFNEAETALSDAQFAQAVGLLEEAYENGFDVAELHAMLAYSRFMAAGQDLETAQHAFELLDYAENMDPSLDLVHAYRGAIHHGLGRPGEARTALNRALELNPYCELAIELMDQMG